MYVYVTKNDKNEFNIERVISYTKNVRGNSGITYGDITILDLQTRIDEGFWTQEDIYDGQDEFKVFKGITTSFDEENALVTNNYIYEDLPLSDIKKQLCNKVDSKRDLLYYDNISFKNTTFSTDPTARLYISLSLSAFNSSPDSFDSNFGLIDINGDFTTLTLAELKELSLKLTLYCSDLYKKAILIKNDINTAKTVKSAISKTKWDDELL